MFYIALVQRTSLLHIIDATYITFNAYAALTDQEICPDVSDSAGECAYSHSGACGCQ